MTRRIPILLRSAPAALRHVVTHGFESGRNLRGCDLPVNEEQPLTAERFESNSLVMRIRVSGFGRLSGASSRLKDPKYILEGRMIRVVVMAMCVAAAPIDSRAQMPGSPTPAAPGAGTQRPGLPGGRMERPPRDPRESPTGTSVIRGRVVTADGGTPIRRVQVRATSAELR